MQTVGGPSRLRRQLYLSGSVIVQGRRVAKCKSSYCVYIGDFGGCETAKPSDLKDFFLFPYVIGWRGLGVVCSLSVSFAEGGCDSGDNNSGRLSALVVGLAGRRDRR